MKIDFVDTNILEDDVKIVQIGLYSDNTAKAHSIFNKIIVENEIDEIRATNGFINEVKLIINGIDVYIKHVLVDNTSKGYRFSYIIVDEESLFNDDKYEYIYNSVVNTQLVVFNVKKEFRHIQHSRIHYV